MEDHLKAAFRTIDREGVGYLEAEALRSVLLQYGASEVGIDEVVASLDLDGDGLVTEQEWVHRMTEILEESAEEERISKLQEAKNPEMVHYGADAEVLSDMSLSDDEKGDFLDSDRLEKVFNRANSNGDGKLTYSDFRFLAQLCDFEIVEKDLLSMFQKLDEDKLGYLTFPQVKSVFSSERYTSIANSHAVARRSMGQKNDKEKDSRTLADYGLSATEIEYLSQTFAAVDKDNSGTVDVAELHLVLLELGLDLTLSDLNGIWQELDESQKGYVTFDEFLLRIVQIYYREEQYGMDGEDISSRSKSKHAWVHTLMGIVRTATNEQRRSSQVALSNPTPSPESIILNRSNFFSTDALALPEMQHWLDAIQQDPDHLWEMQGHSGCVKFMEETTKHLADAQRASHRAEDLAAERELRCAWLEDALEASHRAVGKMEEQLEGMTRQVERLKADNGLLPHNPHRLLSMGGGGEETLSDSHTESCEAPPRSLLRHQELHAEIVQLQSTLDAKDTTIASLESERSRLALRLSAAEGALKSQADALVEVKKLSHLLAACQQMLAARPPMDEQLTLLQDEYTELRSWTERLAETVKQSVEAGQGDMGLLDDLEGLRKKLKRRLTKTKSLGVAHESLTQDASSWLEEVEKLQLKLPQPQLSEKKSALAGGKAEIVLRIFLMDNTRHAVGIARLTNSEVLRDLLFQKLQIPTDCVPLFALMSVSQQSERELRDSEYPALVTSLLNLEGSRRNVVLKYRVFRGGLYDAEQATESATALRLIFFQVLHCVHTSFWSVKEEAVPSLCATAIYALNPEGAPPPRPGSWKDHLLPSLIPKSLFGKKPIEVWESLISREAAGRAMSPSQAQKMYIKAVEAASEMYGAWRFRVTVPVKRKTPSDDPWSASTASVTPTSSSTSSKKDKDKDKDKSKGTRQIRSRTLSESVTEIVPATGPVSASAVFSLEPMIFPSPGGPNMGLFVSPPSSLISSATAGLKAGFEMEARTLTLGPKGLVLSRGLSGSAEAIRRRWADISAVKQEQLKVSFLTFVHDNLEVTLPNLATALDVMHLCHAYGVDVSLDSL